MRARSRNFRTTGVVLCIKQDWFRSSPLKATFADRLRDVFAREYSVSVRDLGSASSRISVRNIDAENLRGTCVAVYDEIYGSLRLTERLYLEFSRILGRLAAAVSAETKDEEDLPAFVARIQKEIEEFRSRGVEDWTGDEPPQGCEYVFTPGSRVCYRQTGQIATDVEIVQPALIEGEIWYQVKVSRRPGQSPPRRWIKASFLEPSADADTFGYALWNRETQEYEETQDDEAP